MTSGRTVALLLTVVFAASLLSGCSPGWKQKFIRKRKGEVRGPQAVLVLESDQKAVLPAPDRYQVHYAFWKSWHSDLLASLGQIPKRDRAYLTGTIRELEGMRSVLTGEPAQKLTVILEELRRMEQEWVRAPATWRPPAATRTRLQKLQRQVTKEFHYSSVKDSFIQEEREG